MEIPHRMIENEHQIGRRGDRLDGVIVDADVAGIDAGPGAVDEAADVLRDALIGVVGRDALARELFRRLFVRMVGGVGERELVVHRVHEPARGEGGRHPAPPLQHEIRGDEELDDAGDDGDRRQRHEDDHQLVPERDPVRFVGDLNGVAEIPLEEVEAQRQRHLELIDQDEEEDVDAGVDVLPQDDRLVRQGPDRDRGPRGEERIGDRHHPAHQAKMGDGENGENEQRRRQRQIAGQLIFLEALRPIAR